MSYVFICDGAHVIYIYKCQYYIQSYFKTSKVVRRLNIKPSDKSIQKKYLSFVLFCIYLFFPFFLLIMWLPSLSPDHPHLCKQLCNWSKRASANFTQQATQYYRSMCQMKEASLSLSTTGSLGGVNAESSALHCKCPRMNTFVFSILLYASG